MAKASALFGKCLERALDMLGGIRSLMVLRLRMQIVPVIRPGDCDPHNPGMGRFTVPGVGRW